MKRLGAMIGPIASSVSTALMKPLDANIVIPEKPERGARNAWLSNPESLTRRTSTIDSQPSIKKLR